MVGTDSPRDRVEAEVRRLGRAGVIERCSALLVSDEDVPGDDGHDFVVALGGDHAKRLFAAHGSARSWPDDQRYWLRVWAARGLLWTGTGSDLEPLRIAFGDGAWRVRELACKVVARHLAGELLDEVSALTADANRRVRVAAERAVVRLVDAEA